MLRGTVKYWLPYRGKLRYGKVTKFWLGDKIFPDETSPLRILQHTSIFRRKVTKFPYFPHNLIFNVLIKGLTLI